MKLKHLLCLAPLALSGCVGYNTALFVTKSNVGLDLDAKPPTVEINIARKELVIEPVFEGGKTPPVMASFSANAGNNGLSRFFFGVNQTFAGGDAAVTMAKLYDAKTPVEVVDGDTANKKRFDSSLKLGTRPENNTKKGWRKALFGLPEESEVRPFVFGTDTQFGLKVNWSGAGGPYPDAVKVGFNRKEMAIAPVTLTNGTTVRIPSFLATVENTANGETTGQTNTLGEKVDVAWMQYFATGEAADYLSRQSGVRKAMLERVDPKASVRSEREEEKEGKLQYETNAARSTEMVKWATKVGKLDSANLKTLIKGVKGLEDQNKNDEIAKLDPADFQKKLNGSWSVYISELWKNFPNKPQE